MLFPLAPERGNAMDIFDRLETYRRRVVVLSAAAALVFAAGILLPAIFGEKAGAGFVPLFLIGILPSLLLLGLIGGIAFFVHRYKVGFRTGLARAVWSEYCEGLVYAPERGFPKERLAAAGMILMGNTYRSQGYLSGRHGPLFLETASVSIKNILLNQKTTASVTFFDGLWVIITLDRPFSCDMLIREKGFAAAQSLSDTGRTPLAPVRVEDEEFLGYFRVSASDGEKAAALLTPTLREAILSVNRTLMGDLMFGFFGRELHVALHGWEEPLEPFVLGRFCREEIRDALLTPIRVVAGLVEALEEEPALFLPPEKSS